MKRNWGPFTASLYAFLMIIAYGSQIFTLFKTNNAKGISLNFILIALLAVLLRISTVGFAIKEIWAKTKIKSIANIALLIAEITVLLGLTIIAIQIIMIRY